MNRLLPGIVAAAALGTIVSTAPAHANLPFSSCSKLNKVYPHGVAKSPAAAAIQVRAGYGRPSTTSAAKQVYSLVYRSLDRDGDGTACER